jgi:hypothetical protein
LLAWLTDRLLAYTGQVVRGCVEKRSMGEGDMKSWLRNKLINWLGIVESAQTREDVLKTVKDQWKYREQQIKEHEQFLDRKYYALEKAAAENTLAVVRSMDAVEDVKALLEEIKKQAEED